MDISKLTDKNEMAAYEYCKQVVVESAQSDEHFNSIDELTSLLNDKNSYVRTRGFGLICAQARWDKEGKIKSVWDNFYYIHCILIPILRLGYSCYFNNCCDYCSSNSNNCCKEKPKERLPPPKHMYQ